MSNIVLQPNSSGTGSITIATPNTNTDRTLNIPDVAGNIVTTGDSGTITQGMVGSGVSPTGGDVFWIYNSSDTSLTDATYVKIALNTAQYNIGGGTHDTSNYRYTPSIAGYYAYSGQVCLTPDGSDLGNFIVNVRKNGTTISFVDAYRGKTGRHSASTSGITYMNGTSDYFDLWCYRETSLSQNAFASGSNGATFLSGHLVRKA